MLCLEHFLIKFLDILISLSDTQVFIFLSQICQNTLPQLHQIAVMTKESSEALNLKASVLILLLSSGSKTR